MTEIFIAFIVGALIGYWARPKDPELQQQIEMYNRNYEKYEQEIQYYKDLCKWHVERKSYDQEKNG